RERKRECCWRRGSQLGPPTGLHDVSSLVPRNPLRAHGSPLCSCFVRRPALGSFNGSLVRSRQTPAGARVLLAQPPCAGGRFCPRGAARPRAENRRGRPAAVALDARADGEVAVEGARRRGRGAQSNAAGRYEPLARIAFDDGWQSFEELPPFKTTVTIDSTRK